MKKTNERGITLVALVVTIVVLLILAGITITYVLSDNGIIGQAQKAAQDTGADHVSSSAALALAATTVEWYDPTGTIAGATDKAATAGTYFSSRLADYQITVTTNFTFAESTEEANKGALTMTGECACTYGGKTYKITYSEATGKFTATPTGTVATPTPGA